MPPLIRVRTARATRARTLASTPRLMFLMFLPAPMARPTIAIIIMLAVLSAMARPAAAMLVFMLVLLLILYRAARDIREDCTTDHAA